MPDDMSPGREPFIDDGRQSPGAAVAPPPHATRPQARPGRKRLFGLLAAVVVLGAIAYAVYYSLALANYISTDDAYVGADVAQVTPLVPGPVQAVMVQDTQAGEGRRCAGGDQPRRQQHRRRPGPRSIQSSRGARAPVFCQQPGVHRPDFARP